MAIYRTEPKYGSILHSSLSRTVFHMKEMSLSFVLFLLINFDSGLVGRRNAALSTTGCAFRVPTWYSIWVEFMTHPSQYKALLWDLVSKVRARSILINQLMKTERSATKQMVFWHGSESAQQRSLQSLLRFRVNVYYVEMERTAHPGGFPNRFRLNASAVPQRAAVWEILVLLQW